MPRAGGDRRLSAQRARGGCVRAGARRCKKGTIAVIAAGERWPDGTLRPAAEDDLCAGAILAALDLDAALSPEARYAASAFGAMRDALADAVRDSVSGRELAEAGYGDEIPWSLEVDVSTNVPVLQDDGFIGAAVS